MTSVVFYFQVHQPLRLRRYRVFDVGNQNYFDLGSDSRTDNQKILNKVAEKCYLPANTLMLDLLKRHPEFKVSYSLSGIFLEQAENMRPDVIRSFQNLVETGRVEILGETYYHSLSSVYDTDEYLDQIDEHARIVKRLFGVSPTSVRNTELIFRNDIGDILRNKGYVAALAEGADRVLEGRSPNLVYSLKNAGNLKVLLKNYKLSDDIAFRFGEKSWTEWPLSADKFAHWTHAMGSSADVINLFMDYETIGEHQWKDSGIFDFFNHLPCNILKNNNFGFETVTGAANRHTPAGNVNFSDYVSWADIERDLSAWTGNELQEDARKRLYSLKKAVVGSGDLSLLSDWKKLTTSDHFYYMCTKWFADGDVHKYFNPYESPYDAYISYSNVLTDLESRIPISTGRGGILPARTAN